MKKLKYLFFISILFLNISNVFAEETLTGLGYLNNSTVIISDNRGNDIQLARNTANSLDINIRNIIFQSNYNIQKNVVYEYEINLANEYINTSVNSIFIRGGDTICNFISLKGLNSSYLKIRFTCPSNISYFTIGLSNLAGSNITDSYQIRWNNIYLWQVNDTIDLGPIINNQTENTQDIINNNNQNTQDIINSNKVCKKQTIKDAKNSGYLSSSGSVVSDNNWKYTDYIRTDKLTLYSKFATDPSVCYYDDEKTLISCNNYGSLSNGLLTLPSGTKYFRASIYINANLPNYNQTPYFKTEYCDNGSQATNDAINGLDDTLKNDNVDENGVADAFDTFNDFLDDNSTITQLITLPITLYTAILNNLNGACSPFNLGKLYGEDLILPCINISQYLGNSLWTMIDIIISGFAVYAISKKMIKVFNNFSSLREGDVIDD